MAKTVVADTGFWYALYTPRDQYHSQANDLMKVINGYKFLLPWPSMYETINSRLAKDKLAMEAFEIFTSKTTVEMIPDQEYRDRALALAFEHSKRGIRSFSLVDLTIREMLSDDTYKINFLLTYNTKDFIDICKKRNIEIYS